MSQPTLSRDSVTQRVEYQVIGERVSVRLGPVSLSLSGSPGQAGSIESSGWYEADEEIGPAYKAAIDAFESVVLSLFMSNVDLSSPQILNGLADSADAIAQHYAEDEPPTVIVRIEEGLLDAIYAPTGMDFKVECLDVDPGLLDVEERVATLKRDKQLRAMVRQGHLHAVY